MAFRKDSKKEHEWQAWLATNCVAIESCGLPSFVLRNELQWASFLEEGEILEGLGDWSGWRCSMLSTDQAARLLRFLETEKLLEGWYVDPSLLAELRRVATSQAE